METIAIVVEGEELEQITVELTKEEVTSIYKQRKEQAKKLTEQTKQIADLERDKKWAVDERDRAKSELEQAHTLMTALGIKTQTDHEESYYRKDLQLSTRIALYISQTRG